MELKGLSNSFSFLLIFVAQFVHIVYMYVVDKTMVHNLNPTFFV